MIGHQYHAHECEVFALFTPLQTWAWPFDRRMHWPLLVVKQRRITCLMYRAESNSNNTVEVIEKDGQ